jgi:flagellar FliL protein
MTVTAMPPATAAEETAEAEPAKRRRKKLAVVVLLLTVLAGAGSWYFLKPSGPPPPPQPGEVIALEPISVNLAGGSYLRIGIALQASADAHEIDGSKALDATIKTFSGKELAQVTTAKQREQLRAELLELVDEAYDGEVLKVYFTEFVTQ